MEFPAEMLVDYVCVYQHKGQTNIGCSPPDYPTMDRIQNHLDAYLSAYRFVIFGSAMRMDIQELFGVLALWLEATVCQHSADSLILLTSSYDAY